VEYRSNKNTSNIIYTYKYTQNMYPKVGLVEETKKGGVERRKDNNNEVCHLCVGARHNETH
jgi:hypothetical protein